MAKKNSGAATADTATAASTDAGTPDATATTTKRDPAGQLYWTKEREIALLNLIYQNPSQLTAAQLAAQLVPHPAFADQASLLANGVKIAEKIRAKVKKLTTAAKTLGRPEPKLRRGAGGRRNDIGEVFDAIFGPVLATAQVATAGPIMPTPAPTPIQQVPQPIPLVPQPTQTAQPVMAGGLISIPG